MLKIGDKVKVNIPEDLKYSTPAAAYDGHELVVSRIAHGNGNAGYSELAGAVSAFGTPFAFLNEWLNKVD